MIISHRYRFIFIKTAKTAGTSIEVQLARHCGPDDVVTPIHPEVEGHTPRNYEGTPFFNHITAAELREVLPAEIWTGYYKFCVERNPWDKTLSHYHMLRERSGGGMTLGDYFTKKAYCVNYRRYTDPEGELLVDRVLRYENLDQELGEVLPSLGVPYEGKLSVRAKSGYRQDRRPYQEVYDDRHRDVISAVFRKEIELFGYTY